MPSTDWFSWLLAATAGLYVVSAVLVISGRVRYERRRELFDRIREITSNPPIGDADTARLEALLNAAPLGRLERALYDMEASDVVLSACALSMARRRGQERLVRRAETGWSRRRRVAAVRALALTGSPDAWPLLQRAVNHSDRESVRAAVVTLGRFPGAHSAGILVHALRTVPFGRAQIATFLEAYPTDISGLLAPLLGEPSPVFRYWGAMLSSRYAGQPHIEARLVGLIEDADPAIRKAAAASLAAADCKGSLPAILTLLDDPVSWVRSQAVLAAGKLGDAGLAPAVGSKLADPDWAVRDAAKRVLEGFGPEVEGVVFDRLLDPDPFARDGAAEILQNTGTYERLLLLEAAGPSSAQRVNQIRMLASMPHLRVWDAVIANLPDQARENLEPLVAEVAARHGQPPPGDCR